MSRLRLPGLAVIALMAATPACAEGTSAPRGEVLYGRCLACHALAYNRTGPMHCGLFGRRAGSLPDFSYSPAMRSSGITWDAAMLDRFLASPTTFVPGTSMGYAGVPDADERAELTAWLRLATNSPDNCPVR